MTSGAGREAHPRSYIDAPLKGIAFLMLGGLFLTVSDAIVKWLAPATPIGQIVFSRGFVPLVIVLVLAARSSEGFGVLRTRDLKHELARGATTIAFTFVMIEALRELPLADCFAILFVAPALLGILAPRMLGERTGFHRWVSIVLGFIGVIIMLRPTGEGLRWVALLPVIAAVVSTFRDIFTRRLAGTDTLLTIQLYTNLALVAGGLLTVTTWQPLPLLDVALLVGAGVFQFLGQHYFIGAFRYAGATVLAPFKYAILVWAMLAGLVVWGDVPDAWSLAGSALIVASGLYIARIERPRLR